ncbi:MAG: ABC transporter ATP-binding protein [Actinomycetota bacterium]|nr:ABC transporter ATP-binding protein [Actinomycetota bacterium]MDQ3627564.1 ABC transporter ATP-binding protein [Actinomycetota bacterium]
MAEAVIVEGVTKSFKLANHKTMKKLVVNAAKRQPLTRSFTALDEISFTLEQGESIGLMGLNGSGKSTLLKLISGVMSPDRGQVLTRGRIAGLIEVGAGFHPDLSGRENIYLNGAILGMSETEIDAKLDAIVDFSEMQEFLESEVRHYSSGMFMRLAFAVAVHTECDIFLIDEMLAVGDQPFKRKCMSKIRELKAAGKTMVFVSHNPKQVLRICNRGLVLEQGRMAFEGTAEDAVRKLGYDDNDDNDEDDR